LFTLWADKSGDLVRSQVSGQMFPRTGQRVILPLNQSEASSDAKFTTRHWKVAELIVIDPKQRTLAQNIDLIEICLKNCSNEWMQDFPLPEGTLPWRSEEATNVLLLQIY
jgi:hypothetical protein